MQSPDESLAGVLERMIRVIRGMATAGGLSLPAAAVLNRIVRDGPQRLTDLAAGEGVSQPAMTQLVSRLERDGLVVRTASPDDGRVVLVEVTHGGQELVERRRAERAAALRLMLDRLDPQDRTAVSAALPALGRLADLALASPSPTSGARA